MRAIIPARYLTALALLAALALPVGEAEAEIYKWVDSSGAMHMTDNLFNVPQEYLPQIKTYQELKGPSETGDIPLVKTESGYVITVKLNGVRELKLLLDTGATSTVVSPAALAEAGVTIPREKQVRVRTASGEVRAAAVEVATLSVGGVTRGPMTVVAHDAVPGFDGLLGMDFLGAYRFEVLTYGPKLRLSPQ